MDRIQLVEDYPANIARSLTEGVIDVGLVPVVTIPQLPEYHIISDYCIGCNGPVASVGLFSEVPVNEIREVLLDYQSRTSVALAGILLSQYWKIKPRLINAGEDFRSLIKGSTAAVVIGDRALEQRQQSAYCYDLGEAWKDHIGLPFVFAAWVSNKKLPQEFIKAFTTANQYGIENIDTVVEENPYSTFDLRQYYTRYISYYLDADKKKGLEKFLKLLKLPVAG